MNKKKHSEEIWRGCHFMEGGGVVVVNEELSIQ